jgi:hypothetical protein
MARQPAGGFARHNEALASFSGALELRKDFAEAHFNQAIMLLTIGDFRRGFEKREWRWRRPGCPRGADGRPPWLGEYPLRGTPSRDWAIARGYGMSSGRAPAREAARLRPIGCQRDILRREKAGK